MVYSAPSITCRSSLQSPLAVFRAHRPDRLRGLLDVCLWWEWRMGGRLACSPGQIVLKKRGTPDSRQVRMPFRCFSLCN